MTVLPVAGGGPLSVTDLESDTVNGAGTAALHPAVSLAARAHGRRRGPRLMCPVPLHLGQGPNGVPLETGFGR